jgi:hypothetical protein
MAYATNASVFVRYIFTPADLPTVFPGSFQTALLVSRSRHRLLSVTRPLLPVSDESVLLVSSIRPTSDALELRPVEDFSLFETPILAEAEARQPIEPAKPRTLVLIVSIVGALQLKNDDRLAAASFVKLMGLSFRYLPLLRHRDRH